MKFSLKKFVLLFLVISVVSLVTSKFIFNKDSLSKYKNLSNSKGLIEEWTKELSSNEGKEYDLNKLENLISILSNQEQFLFFKALESQRLINKGEPGLTEFKLNKDKEFSRKTIEEFMKIKEEKKNVKDDVKNDDSDEDSSSKEDEEDTLSLVKTNIKSYLRQSIKRNPSSSSDIDTSGSSSTIASNTSTILLNKEIYISCLTSIIKNTSNLSTSCTLTNSNYETNNLNETMSFEVKGYSKEEISKLTSINSKIKTTISGTFKNNVFSKEVIIDCVTSFSTGIAKLTCENTDSKVVELNVSKNSRLLADSESSAKNNLERLFDIDFWKKYISPIQSDIKKDLVDYLTKVSQSIRNYLNLVSKSKLDSISSLKAEYKEVLTALSSTNMQILNFINTSMAVLLKNRRWLLTTQQIRENSLSLEENKYSSALPWLESDIKEIVASYKSLTTSYYNLSQKINKYYEFVNISLKNNSNDNEASLFHSAFIADNYKLSDDDVSLITSFISQYKASANYNEEDSLYKAITKYASNENDNVLVSKYNFLLNIRKEDLVESGKLDSFKEELELLFKQTSCEEKQDTSETYNKYYFKDSSSSISSSTSDSSIDNSNIIVYIGCFSHKRIFLAYFNNNSNNEKKKEFSLEIQGVTNKRNISLYQELKKYLNANSIIEASSSSSSSNSKRFLQSLRSNSSSLQNSEIPLYYKLNETCDKLLSEMIDGNFLRIFENFNDYTYDYLPIDCVFSDNDECFKIIYKKFFMNSMNLNYFNLANFNLVNKLDSIYNREKLSEIVDDEEVEEESASSSKSSDLSELSSKDISDVSENPSSSSDSSFNEDSQKSDITDSASSISTSSSIESSENKSNDDNKSDIAKRLLESEIETEEQDDFEENNDSVTVVNEDPVSKDESAVVASEQKIAENNAELDGTTETTPADVEKQVNEDSSIEDSFSSSSIKLSAKTLLLVYSLLALFI